MPLSLVDIHGRVSTLEANMANAIKDVASLARGQTEANNKLDEILTTLAEQRGAGRAFKFVWGIVVTVLGFLGGLAGAGARHL